MIRANTSQDIQKFFAPGGVIAQSFGGFELRPEQVEMAGAVQAALASGRHLAVEAGTGVGKSFAYLIPAIELVRRGAGRVLISTFTITLQEQLINKDIPFLADCLSAAPPFLSSTRRHGGRRGGRERDSKKQVRGNDQKQRWF